MYRIKQILKHSCKVFSLSTLFILFCSPVIYAQETKKNLPIDADLWYIWLDAKIDNEDKNEFLVSEKLQEVYCCVSSKKYRRFLKKIEKEIKRKYNENFSISGTIKKLNDPNLAQKLLFEAQKRKNVTQIKWNASCF